MKQIFGHNRHKHEIEKAKLKGSRQDGHISKSDLSMSKISMDTTDGTNSETIFEEWLFWYFALLWVMLARGILPYF